MADNVDTPPLHLATPAACLGPTAADLDEADMERSFRGRRYSAVVEHNLSFDDLEGLNKASAAEEEEKRAVDFYHNLIGAQTRRRARTAPSFSSFDMDDEREDKHTDDNTDFPIIDSLPQTPTAQQDRDMERKEQGGGGEGWRQRPAHTRQQQCEAAAANEHGGPAQG